MSDLHIKKKKVLDPIQCLGKSTSGGLTKSTISPIHRWCNLYVDFSEVPELEKSMAQWLQFKRQTRGDQEVSLYATMQTMFEQTAFDRGIHIELYRLLLSQIWY